MTTKRCNKGCLPASEFAYCIAESRLAAEAASIQKWKLKILNPGHKLVFYANLIALLSIGNKRHCFKTSYYIQNYRKFWAIFAVRMQCHGQLGKHIALELAQPSCPSWCRAKQF